MEINYNIAAWLPEDNFLRLAGWKSNGFRVAKRKPRPANRARFFARAEASFECLLSLRVVLKGFRTPAIHWREGPHGCATMSRHISMTIFR
jgi:hypothetical protein